MKKISTVLITLIILLSHANAQDFSSFSPGKYALTPFSENGLWGYKNHLGEIVIKPKFEFATPFYDRNIDKLFTVAKYKNKWVIINENGKIKEKLDADEVSLKRNDYAWIYRKDNKYGVIYHNGEILTEPIYDFIQPAPERIEAYRTSHFIYKINGKIGVGFIDDDDKSVFEFIKPDYYQFYNNDMTPININFHENSCFAWGDDAQKIKLDYSILRFIENKTIIYKKFNTYFINYKESKVFTPVKYELDSISPPIKIIPLIDKNDGNLYFYKGIPMLPSKNWYYINDDNEFCRIIKKNGKWGVLFKHNEDEIYQSRNIEYDNIIYDSISSFSYYGITTAYINDKCGLINQSSKIVLDFKFDKIIPLSTNYFALQKDNLWGISYLDTIIFQPIYNDYKLIGNNWHLKKEDNWGVFSHDGKMLCDFKYNKVSRFDTFVNKKLFDKNIIFAKVQLQNKLGIVDENFDEILAPIYDEIGLINIDSSSKDLFVFVKKDGKYGSVNLDKYKKDDIYNLSANYISIKEIENQINLIKKRIESARRLAEQNRIADARRLAEENRIAEARRIAEEKKEAKLAELNRFQNIRKSNIWGVAIGDYYKGGRVIEIYEDGSGILIITGYFSTILKEAKEICKSAFERKMYIADLDEIHDAFRLGIFTEGSKDYAWVVENNTGRYGKYMTIGEKDIISFPGEYSTSRVAYLVERGTIQDMFSGWNEDAKYRCACVKSIGKND